MEVRVLLNSVDITEKITSQTLEVTDVLNERTDLCAFTLRRVRGLVPELQDEVVVEVFDSAWVRIFGGNITHIAQQPTQRLDLEYQVECEDFANTLGAKLVNTRYEATTAGDIIRSIVNLYCPGFTVVGVEDGLTIATMAFDRIPVNEAIQRVASLTNYSWYVDPYKDVHFFASGGEMAPFDLTDTSENFFWDSLKLSRDMAQVRNRVIVRGGLERADSPYTEKFNPPVDVDAPGRAMYGTKHKFDDITSVTVDSVAMTVGRDGVDDDINYEVMWNADQKYIKFTTGNEPDEASIVEVTGTPLFPILVSVQDDDSIAEFANGDFDGVFEHFIKDLDIKSVAEAIQRAQSDLDAYKNELNDGEFRTNVYGLRSGQTINIAAQDVDEDFIIQRSRFREVSPEHYEWQVTVASLKTVGIIEILQRLLRQKTLAAGEGEILLTLLSLDDVFTMTDSVPVVTSTDTEDYVWEQEDPGSDSYPNPIIWDAFTWA